MPEIESGSAGGPLGAFANVETFHPRVPGFDGSRRAVVLQFKVIQDVNDQLSVCRRHKSQITNGACDITDC